ncbi:hypothetical protein BG015_005814 [Linnemannia schmuckeri]|uniref:WD40 repeat-like protein n=1 Tax=Linnemannia schmuckeri TaxID=64567 RepID=A0A9P5S949_9FUNG|nr:hypothetical protein BG015_005814 [Linnemannia schmuckeri]
MAATTTAAIQQQSQDYAEFVAAEGRYELLQDFHLDQVLPHPVIPTYVSSVSVKYKDYLNSSSSGGKKGTGVFGSVFDQLDEQLRDLKFFDERAADDAEEAAATAQTTGAQSNGGGGGGLQLSGNFHGNLVDLPLYNEETSPGAAATGGGGGGGRMSPGGSGGSSLASAFTPPGPPPLKDSTSFGRLSDFSSSSTTTSHSNLVSGSSSSRTLGRASSFSHQLYEEGSAGAMSYQGGGGGLQYSATFGPSSSTSSASGFSSFFAGKRKKPKSNIGKTNSTFVAKITTNENLAKILANRVNEDVYLFWNTGRTFTWSDLGQKPNEPLSHISFSKAFPTAHDVNILTRSCDHLDVIIGFSTGDIIWFNPLSNKYSRLNKQAIIKDSAVTMIKWLPGSESQFMVAFQDGSIVMMDKDKDDNAFTTPIPPEEYSFHATKPKHGRHNPISHWHISRKPINAFAFSPDLQHVAVVAADGELRIIDFRNERLIETFKSYFGALSCVCWSPDGKYILTGGQDDLVTIWSFKDLRIVARCQGHQNYVTGVAFDSWRCDERNYRFGSVGEDAKLLLWDFSVGSLHKPKASATQRHGSNTTVHGTGAFKPGHASKGSITSLRGLGGHSLFNSNRSSLPQHSSVPPPATVPSAGAAGAAGAAGGGLALETVSIDSASISSVPESGRESSTLGASTAELSVLSMSTDGGGLSVLGETASLNSLTGSTSATTTTTLAGTENASIATSSSTGKPPRKALQYAARTLPHLHFNRPNNNPTASAPQQQQQEQQQQQQQQSSLSTMFHHPNAPNSRKSEDAGGVTPTNATTMAAMRGSVDAEREGGQLVTTMTRPPERRSRVAMLQPLMATAIHHEPLASITFREDAILTSDRRGHIKVWKRPARPPSSSVPGGGGHS